MPKLADTPRCIVCGSPDAEHEFPALEAGFEVVRCPDCGLGRTWPPAKNVADYYPESYYGKGNVRFNALFEGLTRWFRRRRARVLHNRVARGPVLDVGCGRGFMLAQLRELGFEPRGHELSEHAAWHARHRLGLEVETGDFLAAKYRPRSFNAIILWHSLEHFERPTDVVARVAEILKPGGLLAVAVPNSESFQARLFGRHWFHLDVPRHYWHFGARSLEALLARHGLRVVKLDHFCAEQNPYGWLQSFYNALGFKPNFLYDLLKSRTARSTKVWQRPFQALLTAALLPPLLAMSLALTLLEAALRTGGTIEVYAIKEG